MGARNCSLKREYYSVVGWWIIRLDSRSAFPSASDDEFWFRTVCRLRSPCRDFRCIEGRMPFPGSSNCKKNELLLSLLGSQKEHHGNCRYCCQIIRAFTWHKTITVVIFFYLIKNKLTNSTVCLYRNWSDGPLGENRPADRRNDQDWSLDQHRYSEER
jgi:hypothetical protein